MQTTEGGTSNRSRKKQEWPVAQVREDGTPAIWITHTHWLLIEPGLVRQYLDNQEFQGWEQARRDWRARLGERAVQVPRLKEWDTLDRWPQSAAMSEAAMAMFQAGYSAYWKYVDPESKLHWTPEKLKAAGERYRAKAYATEVRLLESQLESRYVTAAELVNRLKEQQGYTIKGLSESDSNAFRVLLDGDLEMYLITRAEYLLLDGLIEKAKAERRAA